jgi:hypothetical protein
MERVAELLDVLRSEMDWYCAPGIKSTAFFLDNTPDRAFAVITLPHRDHPNREPGTIVMARVIDDVVVIEADYTDRPLYKRLMDAGIPRERIILRYAGEQVQSAPK